MIRLISLIIVALIMGTFLVWVGANLLNLFTKIMKKRNWLWWSEDIVNEDINPVCLSNEKGGKAHEGTD